MANATRLLRASAPVRICTGTTGETETLLSLLKNLSREGERRHSTSRSTACGGRTIHTSDKPSIYRLASLRHRMATTTGRDTGNDEVRDRDSYRRGDFPFPTLPGAITAGLLPTTGSEIAEYSYRYRDVVRPGGLLRALATTTRASSSGTGVCRSHLRWSRRCSRRATSGRSVGSCAPWACGSGRISAAGTSKVTPGQERHTPVSTREGIRCLSRRRSFPHCSTVRRATPSSHPPNTPAPRSSPWYTFTFTMPSLACGESRTPPSCYRRRRTTVTCCSQGVRASCSWCPPCRPWRVESRTSPSCFPPCRTTAALLLSAGWKAIVIVFEHLIAQGGPRLHHRRLQRQQPRQRTAFPRSTSPEAKLRGDQLCTPCSGPMAGPARQGARNEYIPQSYYAHCGAAVTRNNVLCLLVAPTAD